MTHPLEERNDRGWARMLEKAGVPLGGAGKNISDQVLARQNRLRVGDEALSVFGIAQPPWGMHCFV